MVACGLVTVSTENRAQHFSYLIGDRVFWRYRTVTLGRSAAEPQTSGLVIQPIEKVNEDVLPLAGLLSYLILIDRYSVSR